jgi:hypothetical protein
MGGVPEPADGRGGAAETSAVNVGELNGRLPAPLRRWSNPEYPLRRNIRAGILSLNAEPGIFPLAAPIRSTNWTLHLNQRPEQEARRGKASEHARFESYLGSQKYSSNYLSSLVNCLILITPRNLRGFGAIVQVSQFSGPAGNAGRNTAGRQFGLRRPIFSETL